MAVKDRGQAAGLTETLLRDSCRFTFVQAVRLFRYLLRQDAGDRAAGTDIFRQVRVRPELSLSFPGTDIVNIEAKETDPPAFLITATFLGLYGSSSPLPTFYTEDLLQDRAEERTLTRDFLDIVNSPLYPLFFDCWSKYRLFYQLVEKPGSSMLQQLYCLLGLADDRLRDYFEDAFGLLRYIGLVTQIPRSAEGLRALVADALGLTGVEIVQCILHLTPIPEEQRFSLGTANCRLGENASVGQVIAERTSAFRIRLGPLDIDSFNRILPGHPQFDQLASLIRLYLDQPLDWELELLLDPTVVRPVCLGDRQWARLGHNTWTFAGSPPAMEFNARLSGRVQELGIPFSE